jgi:hypothetical protein
MVAEHEAPHVGDMGEARNRIMVAFWFETFLWTADQKNFEFHLKDLGLSGMFIFQGTITLGNLVALHLCSLWTHMRQQRLSTI